MMHGQKSIKFDSECLKTFIKVIFDPKYVELSGPR
jgi:hypothetical protein